MSKQIRNRVFVSSQRVDGEPAGRLIARLRSDGWRVEHSPRNPADGDDPRWQDWYTRGLDEALRQADVFIIVVDAGWDSSTWMADEAGRVIERNGVALAFYWNPEGISVTAAGMAPYLKLRLPDSLSDLVETLKTATAS